jgi:hypothetical protein
LDLNFEFSLQYDIFYATRMSNKNMKS